MQIFSDVVILTERSVGTFRSTPVGAEVKDLALELMISHLVRLHSLRNRKQVYISLVGTNFGKRHLRDVCLSPTGRRPKGSLRST